MSIAFSNIYLGVDCVKCDRQHSFSSKLTEIIIKKLLFPERANTKLELKFSGLDLN